MWSAGAGELCKCSAAAASTSQTRHVPHSAVNVRAGDVFRPCTGHSLLNHPPFTRITSGQSYLSLFTHFTTGQSEPCPCQTSGQSDLCPCQTNGQSELCPCQTSSMTTEFCPCQTLRLIVAGCHLLWYCLGWC